VVPDRDTARLWSDLFDHAGRLMAKHDRHGIAKTSLYDLKVGVAKPDRLDANKDIIGSKPACFDRLDAQWCLRCMEDSRLVRECHLDISLPLKTPRALHCEASSTKQ
jgi:hypothetical protein